MLKTIQTFIFVGLGLLLKAQCSYTANITIQDADCYGAPTGGAAVTINGGTGPFSYSWNTNPIQSGANISGVKAGNYSVTITDGLNCVSNLLFTIQEPVLLTTDVGADLTVCLGEAFQVGSVVSGGTQPYNYQWSCNQVNCGFSNATELNSFFTPDQNTLYILQVTDQNGCSTSDFFHATVRPAPSVDAGSDVTIYLGNSTELNASSNTDGSYSWSPAQSLTEANASSTTAKPGSTTTYTITVTDLNGCSSTDMVTVNINTDMAIPTGLTPNGDNVNDTWGIKGLVNFPNIKSEVFNRYGDRVYEAFSGDPDWDGTYQNNPLPAGTFFYVIDLGDGSEPLTGTLTLIR